MRNYIKIAALLLLQNAVSNAQQAPACAQLKSMLITGATAHIGNGQVIENSAIGFKNGELTFVGQASAVDAKQYEEIINASGKHVYPGFIAPNIPIGLEEIGAVRATIDNAEVGAYNPNVRTIVAYNTDSRIIPTIRSNGVLLAQATPRGGVVSGTSSIVELDAWCWDDAAYKIDDGIHVNWPQMFYRNWWGEEPGKVEKSKGYDKDVNTLHKFFADAKAYASEANQAEKNLRFEAMRGIFNGKQTLYIHSNKVKELLAAVNFIKEFKIPRVAIVGGNESYIIADLLKENNIGVVIGRVHELPQRDDDDVDQCYKLPYLLQKAGVTFCISNEGDMEVMGSRNLPFQAGTGVTYGLTKEEAVSAISFNAAKILGIDKTVGTLEKGKDATLFISTGDALDMRTNNVEMAFMRGRNIDLDNAQKALYRKFSEKYGLKP